MRLTYDFEAQIQIWNQALPSHPGHVSLELRSALTANRSYISWWPGSGDATYTRHYTRSDAKRAELGHSAREGFDGFGSVAEAQIAYSVAQFAGRGGFNPTAKQKPLKGNVNKEWGQSADLKTAIPMLGSASVGSGKVPAYFGIDGKAVRHWWSAKLALANAGQVGYKFVSKTHNCSGVVTEALLAGGAGAYFAAPKALISTPNKVVAWQERLEANITALNRSFNWSLFRITQILDAETKRWIVAPVDDVMSQQLWLRSAGKAESNEDRAVDAAVQLYHSLPAWNDENASKKLSLMVNLARAACTRIGKTNGGDGLVRGGRYYQTLQLVHQISDRVKARGASPLAN